MAVDRVPPVPGERLVEPQAVTAAAPHIPQPLVDQLKPGGRMVIPVGATSMSQELMVIEKDRDGRTHTRRTLPVRFVPLTGQHR